MEQQAVTISVITYNSSKYVLETLESIKAQTYPNLVLHICDDCSTDNTIEICEKWIKVNSHRFINTNIIVPEHNTGVSANCNRAMDACETEYHKEIAGDDILLPNCIQDNIEYVKSHTEAIVVFSKIKAFGASKERNEQVASVFDYYFFELNIESQLKRLINSGNCIPAASCFYNIKALRELKMRNDERIPLLEDWPKWINMLKKGIRFHFLNVETVLYRISEDSLSTTLLASPKYYYSCRLFYYNYRFEEKYKENPERTVEEIINHEYNIYANTVIIVNNLQNSYNNAVNSWSYRIGDFLLKPVRFLKHIYYKTKTYF